MIPEQSIHESPPRHLAGLLRPSTEAGRTWSGEELGEILRHQMTVPVETDLGLAEEVDAGPAAGSGGPPGAKATTFGDLFHRPQPPLDLLRRAKDYAKSVRMDPRAPLPAGIATALYFASIAAALVHCGQRLTSLEEGQLLRGLRWLLGQPWVDDPTRALAREGLAALGPAAIPTGDDRNA